MEPIAVITAQIPLSAKVSAKKESLGLRCRDCLLLFLLSCVCFLIPSVVLRQVDVSDEAYEAIALGQLGGPLSVFTDNLVLLAYRVEEILKLNMGSGFLSMSVIFTGALLSLLLFSRSDSGYRLTTRSLLLGPAIFLLGSQSVTRSPAELWSFVFGGGIFLCLSASRQTILIGLLAVVFALLLGWSNASCLPWLFLCLLHLGSQGLVSQGFVRKGQRNGIRLWGLVAVCLILLSSPAGYRLFSYVWHFDYLLVMLRDNYLGRPVLGLVEPNYYLQKPLVLSIVMFLLSLGLVGGGSRYRSSLLFAFICMALSSELAGMFVIVASCCALNEGSGSEMGTGSEMIDQDRTSISLALTVLLLPMLFALIYNACVMGSSAPLTISDDTKEQVQGVLSSIDKDSVNLGEFSGSPISGLAGYSVLTELRTSGKAMFLGLKPRFNRRMHFLNLDMGGEIEEYRKLFGARERGFEEMRSALTSGAFRVAFLSDSTPLRGLLREVYGWREVFVISYPKRSLMYPKQARSLAVLLPPQ